MSVCRRQWAGCSSAVCKHEHNQTGLSWVRPKMGHGCDAHEELASRARSCRAFQGSVRRLSQRSQLLGDGRSLPTPAQKGRAIETHHPISCACVSAYVCVATCGAVTSRVTLRSLVVSQLRNHYNNYYPKCCVIVGRCSVAAALVRRCTPVYLEAWRHGQGRRTDATRAHFITRNRHSKIYWHF